MTQYGANKPSSNLSQTPSNLLKPHPHVHILQQQTHSKEHTLALPENVGVHVCITIHIKSDTPNIRS